MISCLLGCHVSCYRSSCLNYTTDLSLPQNHDRYGFLYLQLSPTTTCTTISIYLEKGFQNNPGMFEKNIYIRNKYIFRYTYKKIRYLFLIYNSNSRCDWTRNYYLLQTDVGFLVLSRDSRRACVWQCNVIVPALEI